MVGSLYFFENFSSPFGGGGEGYPFDLPCVPTVILSLGDPSLSPEDVVVWSTIEVFPCIVAVVNRVAHLQAEVFLLEQPAGRHLAQQSDYDGAMDTKAEPLPQGVELPRQLKKEH